MRFNTKISGKSPLIEQIFSKHNEPYIFIVPKSLKSKKTEALQKLQIQKSSKMTPNP
jgi:hypothetical protein